MGDVIELTPRCNKCGLEITTGMMAAFCPLHRECEFWVDGNILLEDLWPQWGKPTRDLMEQNGCEVTAETIRELSARPEGA